MRQATRSFLWILPILLVIVLVIVLGSCGDKSSQETRSSTTTEGVKVRLELSAGDLYRAINFLPLPVNVATFKNIPSNDLECWIISKRIKQNKSVHVDLFALIEYDDGSLKKSIILATPSNEKYQTIKTTDLMDFSLEHGEIKSLLESWLKQYKGTKSTVRIKWKDKQEALRYLQKHEKLNALKK